ncbi:MAG: hypothetical protein ACYDAO_02215 [Thermoplasmataceae archaeon]
MKYQIILNLALLFFLIYSLLIMVTSGYLISEAVILISILLFIFGIIHSRDFDKNEPYLEPKNKLKFIAILLPIILIIFSRGYISTYFTSFYSYSPASTRFMAIIFPIAELSIVLLINYESAYHLEQTSIIGGYDEEDVREELGKFSITVLSIAIIALVIGYVSYAAAFILPTFNIGLIPALIIFFAVYILLMRNVITKTTSTE